MDLAAQGDAATALTGKNRERLADLQRNWGDVYDVGYDEHGPWWQLRGRPSGRRHAADLDDLFIRLIDDYTDPGRNRPAGSYRDQLDEHKTRVEAEFSGWRAWYVLFSQGGVRWYAQSPRDGDGPGEIVQGGSPVHLADAILAATEKEGEER